MKGEFRRAQGFLLIEVVVALAVFAVSAAIIVQSFANGLVAKYQRENSPDAGDRLLFLVDQVFEQIRGGRSSKEDLANGGEMHFPDGSCWRWKMLCQPTNVLNLFQISLELILPKGQEEYQFYRWVPEWKDWDQETKAKEYFQKNKGKGLGKPKKSRKGKAQVLGFVSSLSLDSGGIDPRSGPQDKNKREFCFYPAKTAKYC
ncbi:MAG: prepilin-type N-terminal cleavage/methylation domain-containing protein [Puniceicoccales bacterium]|nr:prepilin-type N-terminal cleavage/methylation domain-containing protein [Puniceicoccales bacterium]